MKTIFVWLIGYYCVGIDCMQLHKPVRDMTECELEINKLTLDFVELNEKYPGRWELDCVFMLNKYTSST